MYSPGLDMVLSYGCKTLLKIKLFEENNRASSNTLAKGKCTQPEQYDSRGSWSVKMFGCYYLKNLRTLSKPPKEG